VAGSLVGVIEVLDTVLITTAYSLLLPFAFTQRFSLQNWQFLTTRLLVFAIALGAGMALVLTVQIYAVRRAVAARRAAGDSALSGVALIVSVLDPTGKITYTDGVPASTMDQLLSHALAAAKT